MPILTMEQTPYKYQIPVEGGVFNTNLHYLGKAIGQMTRGFSPLIAICGRQRAGKSYLGMIIANQVMKCFNKPFNLERTCFYEPYDVVQSLDEGANLDVRMIDESGVMISKRRWFDQTHFALSTIVQTQGLKAICYIFVSPFLDDIDKTFVKHFDFIINVKRRGHYKVWQIRKYYDKLGNRSTSRLFLDDVFYDKSDLDANIWKEYEKYSFAKKEELRNKYSKPAENKKENNTTDTLKEKWGLV